MLLSAFTDMKSKFNMDDVANEFKNTRELICLFIWLYVYSLCLMPNKIMLYVIIKTVKHDVQLERI